MKSQVLGRSLVVSGLTAVALSLGVMSNAHAIAMGAASSYINWNSLSISTSQGVSVDLDTTYSVNIASTAALNSAGDIQLDTAFVDNGTGAVSHSVVPGGLGYASASSNRLVSVSGAQGSGVVGDSSYAESYSSRDAELMVTGSGMVTFSVKYLLSTIAMSQELFESAFAFADAWLSVENITTGVLGRSTDYSEAFSQDGSGNMRSSNSGLLSLTMNVMDGDFLYLWTDAYTSAEQYSGSPVAVPAPASILLVLAGLLGLGASRNSFRKQQL